MEKTAVNKYVKKASFGKKLLIQPITPFSKGDTLRLLKNHILSPEESQQKGTSSWTIVI